jgi:hypothetical protein
MGEPKCSQCGREMERHWDRGLGSCWACFWCCEFIWDDEEEDRGIFNIEISLTVLDPPT